MSSYLTKFRRKVIVIDSSKRDKTRYPNPNQYTIPLYTKLKNVKSLRLIGTEFINTESLISESFNDQITILLLDEKNKISSYNVKLPTGNYTIDELKTVILESIHSTLPENIMIEMDLNSVNGKIEFRAFRVLNQENPISVLPLTRIFPSPISYQELWQDDPIHGYSFLRVHYPNHNVYEFPFIQIVGANYCNGLNLNLVNTKHVPLSLEGIVSKFRNDDNIVIPISTSLPIENLNLYNIFESNSVIQFYEGFFYYLDPLFQSNGGINTPEYALFLQLGKSLVSPTSYMTRYYHAYEKNYSRFINQNYCLTTDIQNIRLVNIEKGQIVNTVSKNSTLRHINVSRNGIVIAYFREFKDSGTDEGEMYFYTISNDKWKQIKLHELDSVNQTQEWRYAWGVGDFSFNETRYYYDQIFYNFVNGISSLKQYVMEINILSPITGYENKYDFESFGNLFTSNQYIKSIKCLKTDSNHDILLISQSRTKDVGRVYMFLHEYGTTNMNLLQTLAPPDVYSIKNNSKIDSATIYEEFGARMGVSYDGKWLAIGDSSIRLDASTVYIYKNIGISQLYPQFEFIQTISLFYKRKKSFLNDGIYDSKLSSTYGIDVKYDRLDFNDDGSILRINIFQTNHVFYRFGDEFFQQKQNLESWPYHDFELNYDLLHEKALFSTIPQEHRIYNSIIGITAGIQTGGNVQFRLPLKLSIDWTANSSLGTLLQYGTTQTEFSYQLSNGIEDVEEATVLGFFKLTNQKLGIVFEGGISGEGIQFTNAFIRNEPRYDRFLNEFRHQLEDVSITIPDAYFLQKIYKPFYSTSAGVSFLRVYNPNHGLCINQPIRITNATDFDGVDAAFLNSTHFVHSIIDSDTYSLYITGQTSSGITFIATDQLELDGVSNINPVLFEYLIPQTSVVKAIDFPLVYLPSRRYEKNLRIQYGYMDHFGITDTSIIGGGGIGISGSARFYKTSTSITAIDTTPNDFIYMQLNQLDNSVLPILNDTIPSILARIKFIGNAGERMVNEFDTGLKLYNHNLPDFDSFSFAFLTETNQLYDFKNQDHVFYLEAIEYIDQPNLDDLQLNTRIHISDPMGYSNQLLI